MYTRRKPGLHFSLALLAVLALSIGVGAQPRNGQHKVFDQSGKLLSSTALKSARESVDITNYAAGLYYVTFVGYNGNFVTKKFAVAH